MKRRTSIGVAAGLATVAILVSVPVYLGINYNQGDIDACNDFYKFACGEWERQNPLSDEMESLTTLDQIQMNINEYFLKILSDDSYSKDDRQLRAAKDFYKSCTNSRSLDAMRLTYYRLINKNFGEWDLIPSIPQKLNISGGGKKTLRLTDYVLTTLFETGHSLLFSLKVDPVSKTIDIAPGLLIVDVNSFEQKFYETAFQLGVNESEKKQLKDAFGMMIRLHREIKISESLQTQELKKNVTFDELSSSCPQIQWSDVFEKMERETGYRNYKSLRITLKRDILLYQRCEEYRLAAKNAERNFHTMMIMDFIFQQSQFALKPIIPGEDDHSSSQLHLDVPCINRVRNGFKWTLERHYLQSHVNETHKQQIRRLFEETRRDLLISISKISWLNPLQKEYLSNKIRSVRLFALYFNFNDSRTKEDRSTVYNYTMKEDDYYLNEIQIRKANHMDALKQALFNYVPSLTKEPKFKIDAYYTRTSENRVYIYAGYLERTTDDSSDDLFKNIGRVGFTLGHELIHAIDIETLKSDATNYGQPTEIQKSLLDAVQNRSQCLRNQYNASGATGEKNPKLDFLDELIADNGGLKLAYNTYRRFLQEKNPDHANTILNFTLKFHQYFFLQFAKGFCGHRKGKALIKYENAVPHVLETHRINGALSNSKEFAEAYGCPVGSPMNPVHKCTLY